MGNGIFDWTEREALETGKLAADLDEARRERLLASIENAAGDDPDRKYIALLTRKITEKLLEKRQNEAGQDHPDPRDGQAPGPPPGRSGPR